MPLDLDMQAVQRWARSVPAKELEANIVMLAGSDAMVPITFQDGWRHEVPATLIVRVAANILA
jgi:hypothetical protein